MAICNKCGKRGLFLRLNSNGRCDNCVQKEIIESKTAEAERKRLYEEARQREIEYRRTHDEFGHQVGDVYTFVPVRVAGVTFKNDRRERQTILRNIYWKDEPYKRIDRDHCIELIPTLYEGNDAVEVWVYCKKIREQIGYIPKEEASYFCQNIDRLHSCFDFQVNGGGTRMDGEKVCFGATFTARFFNKPGQGEITSELFSAFVNMRNSTLRGLEKDICTKAFEYFKKQYPHALIEGWIRDADNNGIIIYISQKPCMIVRYDSENKSYTIYRYDEMY